MNCCRPRKAEGCRVGGGGRCRSRTLCRLCGGRSQCRQRGSNLARACDDGNDAARHAATPAFLFPRRNSPPGISRRGRRWGQTPGSESSVNNRNRRVSTFYRRAPSRKRTVPVSESSVNNRNRRVSTFYRRAPSTRGVPPRRCVSRNRTAPGNSQSPENNPDSAAT